MVSTDDTAAMEAALADENLPIHVQTEAESQLNLPMSVDVDDSLPSIVSSWEVSLQTIGVSRSVMLTVQNDISRTVGVFMNAYVWWLDEITNDLEVKVAMTLDSTDRGLLSSCN